MESLQEAADGLGFEPVEKLVDGEAALLQELGEGDGGEDQREEGAVLGGYG
jgi:hypothetical protein